MPSRFFKSSTSQNMHTNLCLHRTARTCMHTHSHNACVHSQAVTQYLAQRCAPLERSWALMRHFQAPTPRHRCACWYGGIPVVWAPEKDLRLVKGFKDSVCMPHSLSFFISSLRRSERVNFLLLCVQTFPLTWMKVWNARNVSVTQLFALILLRCSVV